MSKAERRVAYCAMLVFGVPTLMVALLGGEVWPFLDYRMYAEAQRSAVVDWLELVGRTDQGRPFRLHDERYIVPFAPSELLRALYSLDVLGEVDQQPARRALRGLLIAYEQQRRAGEHDGPPLVGLEVYRVRWTAEAGAANFTRPDSRQLVLAVRSPEAVP